MTSSDATRTHVLLLVGTGSIVDDVTTETAPQVPEWVRLAAVETPEAAAEVLAGDDPVGLVVLAADHVNVDDAVDTMMAHCRDRCPTVLLLAQRPLPDAVRTIASERLDGIIALPWTPGRLGPHLLSRIRRWQATQEPETSNLEELTRVLATSDYLSLLWEDTPDLVDHLVTSIEKSLGPRPRLQVPAGTEILHENALINGIMVVVRGAVELTMKSRAGELRLHHVSTGPLIGLLSLTDSRRSIATAAATTDCELIHLTMEQLDRALREEPGVGAAMAAVSLKEMVRRLRRSHEQQIEKTELGAELEAERVRLTQALTELEEARVELAAQVSYVTLGELAAGLVHELNNPLAALKRSTDHLAEDLTALATLHPDGTVLADRIDEARHREPMSTAQERAARRDIAAVVGSKDVARRLVSSGITNPDDARTLASSGEDAIRTLELASGVGVALRNLTLGTEHIARLVSSLRSSMRPTAPQFEFTDINETIEDAIRLTAHRLTDIDIRREYDTTPRLPAHPGQLTQLWINLLSNAAEALDSTTEPAITLVLQSPKSDRIIVSVVDNGPGISPDNLEAIFRPRFTTKFGQVRYGLGMGLGIAKRIVVAHGGDISVRSEPGRTAFTVTLPVNRGEELEADTW